jgi:hypothetical protein
MRTILMWTAVVLCVASLMAQNKQEGTTVRNPTTHLLSQGRVEPAARQPELPLQDSADLLSNTPVVTLDGVCDRPRKGGTGASCKTVMTRAQMDSMINTLEPNAPPMSRRQLAINYARLLAASGVAERRHLDKDPAVAKELQIQQKIVRMQVLANRLYQQIKAQAANVSTSEIEQYYADHQASFEQGDVRRLSIPRPAPTTNVQTQDDSAWKAKADELRKRAAAGEDFDHLQRDGYKDLGIEATAPPTKLNMVRRSNLRPVEGIVFDLKPGEVSPVLDSQGTLVILKLESKQSISMEAARQEIQSVLRLERMQQELRNATQSAKAQFNLRYLDTPSAPELFPPPVLAQLPAQPGPQPNSLSRVPSRRRMPSRAPGMTVLPRPPR